MCACSGDVARRLSFAKAEAEKVQRRIVRPLLAVAAFNGISGTSLLVVCILCSHGDGFGGLLDYGMAFGCIIASIGLTSLMMTVFGRNAAHVRLCAYIHMVVHFAAFFLSMIHLCSRFDFSFHNFQASVMSQCANRESKAELNLGLIFNCTHQIKSGFTMVVMAFGLMRFRQRRLLNLTWNVWTATMIYDAFVIFTIFVVMPSVEGELFIIKGQEVLIAPGPSVIWVLSLIVLSSMSMSAKLRSSIQVWLATRSSGVATAAGIAAVLTNMPVEGIIALAAKRFRAVTPRDLQEVHFLHSTGGIAGRGVAEEFARLAKPARIGEVDVFVSHSWHDDGHAKFLKLQEWCSQFQEEHGREPSLWIDIYCIDQTNLTEDLLCLAVFLASCKKVVVLFGHTYLQRLWCAVELLVFVNMGGSEEEIEFCVIEGQRQSMQEQLMNFDLRNVACFNPDDKERLLSVVELGFQGVRNVNAEMKAFLERISKIALRKPFKHHSMTL